MDRKATEQWIKKCLKDAKSLGVLPEKGVVNISVLYGEYGTPPGLRASFYAPNSELKIDFADVPASISTDELLA